MTTPSDHPLDQPTPEADAWSMRHKDDAPDKARVYVWWPTDTPYATLQTVSVPMNDHGGRREILPDGQPMVNLRLGPVEIGGALKHIEQWMGVLSESLVRARAYADHLSAERFAAEAARAAEVD